MNTLTLPRPGLRFGDYPERQAAHSGTPDLWARCLGWLPAPLLRQRLWRDAGRAWQQAHDWQQLSDAALQQQRTRLQGELQHAGLHGATGWQACALAAEAARRATGRQAYRGQHMAALAMLHGCLAEMATGEGKTLAAALAAGVGALAGLPVHVFTANDYLVRRDAQALAPFFRLLGLGVGHVCGGDSSEQRRAAYAQPVTYVTARELAFDYLRDRLQHGTGLSELQRRAGRLGGGWPAPLLRGLCMAVIDEADSVLVDEAQMPLLLSRSVNAAPERAFQWQAHRLAQQLQAGPHFVCRTWPERVLLTPAGQTHLAQLAAGLGPAWQRPRVREAAITTALTAQHVLQRDRDYVVAPQADAQGRVADAVHIVDRHTGRLAHGRQWQRGLHEQVALKEGCALPGATETVAQITFQQLFRRYHRVGGMSGTLAEAGRELRTLYGTPLVRVPLRLPSRAERHSTRCWPSDAARRAAVVVRAAALAAQGRPVLVGCDSVLASEALSAALNAAGLPHQVLHARQDAFEAAIVAAAGQAGQITVATSMAGRGTDIELDAAARAAGGLHVLSCQHNASRRHDRQLSGRSARHGEPGSHEHWLTPDGPGLPPGLAAALRLWQRLPFVLPANLLNCALHLTQWLAQSQQARLRWRLLQQDIALQRQLAFAGPRPTAASEELP
jgi:preprotein translocase subunit SecA